MENRTQQKSTSFFGFGWKQKELQSLQKLSIVTSREEKRPFSWRGNQYIIQVKDRHFTIKNTAAYNKTISCTLYAKSLQNIISYKPFDIYSQSNSQTPVCNAFSHSCIFPWKLDHYIVCINNYTNQIPLHSFIWTHYEQCWPLKRHWGQGNQV